MNEFFHKIPNSSEWIANKYLIETKGWAEYSLSARQKSVVIHSNSGGQNEYE